MHFVIRLIQYIIITMCMNFGKEYIKICTFCVLFRSNYSKLSLVLKGQGNYI
jgi:hypothetical protein